METTSIDDITSALAADLDAAFPEVVRSRQDGVYSGIVRIVRHPADAADITQETFIRAYRALAGYEPQRIEELSLDGWLWTIALNLCRNRGRKRHALPSERIDGADPAAGPEEQAIQRDELSTWDGRLRRLTPTQRTAVVLRHIVGLSYEEISTATGRPTGTVKADVHRGISRLRRLLEMEEAT